MQHFTRCMCRSFARHNKWAPPFGTKIRLHTHTWREGPYHIIYVLRHLMAIESLWRPAGRHSFWPYIVRSDHVFLMLLYECGGWTRQNCSETWWWWCGSIDLRCSSSLAWNYCVVCERERALCAFALQRPECEAKMGTRRRRRCKWMHP